ncbi:N(4)-(beta-N-acetylglucosaminyl)-L-asparaginase [Lapidilactobacillus achengensis]|uniref:N(4)-(Beta-N-acetylglucosaminyl)-L-asparaginase n=1 Tax=Lapidilactobacillus achengensis TaxID=2486000 RepID=A0ABW1UQH5_9LACO|nr:N(4)-(beta-N-acetylglucosaminyl)-L-asparaginase [Lapidilactobacillus achengensis]
MWGMIATWQMARDGVATAAQELQQQGDAGDALVTAIKDVENNPEYGSVGYGGLPNEHGLLEMDAAYMNGNTYGIGAVAGITDVKNPITVARKLSHDHFNSFRVGAGATEYAQQAGFERVNMLTPAAVTAWQERVAEVAGKNLTPYDGHDTVGVVALDQQAKMVAGTSTSGLFMKKHGRVGDSPLSGSGFYVDSEIGGATATGLGEDIMKGVLSYEIVRLMKSGLTPQAACDQATYDFDRRLKQHYGKAGAFSLIALDKQGNWGVATNCEFTFAVATATQPLTVYTANPGPDDSTTFVVTAH